METHSFNFSGDYEETVFLDPTVSTETDLPINIMMYETAFPDFEYQVTFFKRED